MSTNRPKAARPTNPKAPAGGSYLVEPAEAHEIFVPEDFDEELRAIGQTAQEFATKEILPQTRAMESKEGKAAKLPIQILRKSAELGFCMIDIPEEYGGLDMGVLASILLTEKMGVEGAFSVTFGAHVGIGTLPIVYFGSEETKARYLPKLATAEYVGAYCLSEPGSGSDALGARTKAVLNEAGTHYVLNGTKMWITNGSMSDVAVVWAQTGELGDVKGIRGFVVPTDTPGFTATDQKGKLSLLASDTSELHLDDVEVPESALMPGSTGGLKHPLQCLTQARYGIAWGAVGAAMACFDEARSYAVERVMFDGPIGGKQIQQVRLADMLTKITQAQLLVHRLGRLKDAGTMTPQQVSLAKRANVDMACDIAREARRLLGGNGILVEYHSMRHMANLESVYTYEGTHDIHNLVLGRWITGIQAFQ